MNKKQELLNLLKIHYGFEKFRPGQELAIDSILAGKDVVVILPTGGGKSLIYQLPALVLDGITIVISPLIALMKDQVDSLKKVGIPAAFINSSLSPTEVLETIEAVKNGLCKLLYIAPERFYNQEFLALLSGLKVALFAIDEAHCISQWGHDFRPSYVRLKDAIKSAGSPPVAALTATATIEVKEDIIKQLDLKNPEVIVTGFGRPNLQFGVIQAHDSQKSQFIIDAIKSVPDGSGIVYVGTRAKADNLLQILLENGINAVAYHAGMDSQDRQWVQEDFINGKAKVVVATNAFGLGINKKDVRFVIHYDMPGTIEAYYQEAGRAGRDGKPSFCLLFYSPRDRYLREFFIKGDNPPPTIIQEIYEFLTNYESESGKENTILITYSDIASNLSDQIPEMAVGTALKILEREGYIKRPNDKVANAYLKLTTDFDTALNSLGKRAKAQIEILAKLFDRHKDDILSGWHFNFDEIADSLEIKKESFMRLARGLKDGGMAEYKPPFKGTEINILKRVKPSEINIDFSGLKDKLRKAYDKLDEMENYIYHFACRQEYILKYFGDQNAHPCAKCDNCLNGGNKIERKEKTYSHEPKRFYPKKVKITADFEVDAPIAKSVLSTKLTQLETLELFNKGLSLENIALEREIAVGTVIGHIIFLIEKKLIKPQEIDKLVDGRKQKKIKEAIEKVGSEKLTPIKEIVGDDASYEDIKLVLAGLNLKK